MKKRLVMLLMATVVVFSLSGCKKSPEVEAVETQIESFGEVNEESGEKIKEIEDAYNALEQKEQKHVKNYKKFVKYEEEYNKLLADKVVKLIDKIDTSNIKKSIDAVAEASTEYSKLTDDQKEFVSNYDVLEGAEKQLVDETEKLIKTALENGTEENYRAAENAYLALSGNIKSQITDYSEMAAAYLKLSTGNLKAGDYGRSEFSDIFVSINNYNIPSEYYNGDLYVSLEDIKNYGFNSEKSQNTITISRNSDTTVNPVKTYRCAETSIGIEESNITKANVTAVINGVEVQTYDSYTEDDYIVRAKDLANLENVRFEYDSKLKCIKIYVNDGLETNDTLKVPDTYKDIVGDWCCIGIDILGDFRSVPESDRTVGYSLLEDHTIADSNSDEGYTNWEYCLSVDNYDVLVIWGFKGNGNGNGTMPVIYDKDKDEFTEGAEGIEFHYSRKK